MNMEDAKNLLPMTAQPLSLNPAPSSVEFIERQIARLSRLRDIDSDDARTEAARCEDNLKLSARTILGRVRIALAKRKFGWL